MQESSKGRKLTAAERQELLSNPLKLIQTLLGPLGVLYSGLKPAAIETVASQAVSQHSTDKQQQLQHLLPHRTLSGGLSLAVCVS